MVVLNFLVVSCAVLWPAEIIYYYIQPDTPRKWRGFHSWYCHLRHWATQHKAAYMTVVLSALVHSSISKKLWATTWTLGHASVQSLCKYNIYEEYMVIISTYWAISVAQIHILRYIKKESSKKNQVSNLLSTLSSHQNLIYFLVNRLVVVAFEEQNIISELFQQNTWCLMIHP